VHDVQALLALAHPFFAANGRPHWFQDFQRPAGAVLASALDWIRAGGDERPWFCLVNLYDAHWPYLPEDETRSQLVTPYAGTFDGFLFRSARYDASKDGKVKGSQLDELDRRHAHELYSAEIFDLDRDVAGFLAALDLDRTGVVVTSDHGEAFGEADHWEHSGILEPQVRVPLVVRPPGGAGRLALDGGARGARIAGKASGVDVAPTLLAMAGCAAPAHMVGLDLTSALPPPDRAVVVERLDELVPALRSVALYRDSWKLLRHGLGEGARYSLFDLATDPLGTRDVGAEHPEVRDELAALLEELRAAWRADAELDAAGGADLGDALEGLGYMGDDAGQ
jgi:arylsulfatase A-like enzyme